MCDVQIVYIITLWPFLAFVRGCVKSVHQIRDLNLIFPFLKWEFGGCLFHLFRMTSLIRDLNWIFPFLVCIPCQKMFDLGRSPQVGQMNDPQNPIIKMGKLNGSLFNALAVQSFIAIFAMPAIQERCLNYIHGGSHLTLMKEFKIVGFLTDSRLCVMHGIV